MKLMSLKNALALALFLAGMTALQAMAHVGYSGRTFDTITGAIGESQTISNQSVGGNHGWIDGTDADWGDSHRLRFYRFHLDNDATVKITFQDQAFTTAAGVNVSGGMNVGFSLFSGLAHIAPFAADHDFAVGSEAIRLADSGGAFTEGSFRALTTWRITNNNDDPASVFTYIGHAYDGSVDYGTGVIAGGDGVADNMVTGLFNLTAGDYSIAVGGTDYDAQLAGAPWPLYGVEGMVSVVPEPEIYAMLLAGLGLVGFAAKRRRNEESISIAPAYC